MSILVRPIKHDQSLKEFATFIFQWLEITNFKEECPRDYPVFIGSAAGIEVMIDENFFGNRVDPYKLRDLEKYRFSIRLGAHKTKQAADYLHQHADILAWRLSHEGFRCFVPKEGASLSSERDGMVYDF